MNQTACQKECETCALKMDQLMMARDYDKLKTYLKEAKAFAESHHSPEYAQIFYCIGTGYSMLADGQIFTEEQRLEYQTQAIYYLREAMHLMEPGQVDDPFLASIYTNYANELFDCQRVMEALRLYRKAIALNVNFGMALGNYGRALSFYANLVNDKSQYDALHRYAYRAFKKALEVNDPNVHKEARKAFERKVEEYQGYQSEAYLLSSVAYSDYSCEDASERAYRQWCLEQHLFLNPMNDLMDLETAFAYDPLTITDYTETEKDKKTGASFAPPRWYAMLNQIKEEYIYARFLFYESTEKKSKVHYADKDVQLAWCCDDAKYSIRLEQLKSAFRILYSVFDQVAFFVNAFWELGFPERYADASRVFDAKARIPRNDRFRNAFLKKAECNRALMALYWSHLDFIQQFEKSKFASEKDLKTLRNALEHKFVKIHMDEMNGCDTEKLQIKKDDFYHIGEKQLKRYTFRLLQLAREWIMELVYAIGIEEKNISHDENEVCCNIRDYDDQWKI